MLPLTTHHADNTLLRRPPETWEHEGLGIWARWEQYAARACVDLENVYYVQVGANCGANVRRCALGGDPIYEYATQCAGWSGVSIEPVMHTFGELQANYASHPNVLTLRAAIAEEGGTDRVPRLSALGKTSEKVSLSRWSAGDDGGTSDDGNSSDGKWEAVPVLTLQQLWQHLRPSKVDVLVVDAEGREPSILGTAADLPTPQPRLVLFEMSHLGKTQRALIDKRLRAQGYAKASTMHYAQRAARARYVRRAIHRESRGQRHPLCEGELLNEFLAEAVRLCSERWHSPTTHEHQPKLAHHMPQIWQVHHGGLHTLVVPTRAAHPEHRAGHGAVGPHSQPQHRPRQRPRPRRRRGGAVPLAAPLPGAGRLHQGWAHPAGEAAARRVAPGRAVQHEPRLHSHRQVCMPRGSPRLKPWRL